MYGNLSEKISGMKRGKAVAIACHYGRKKTNPWLPFSPLKINILFTMIFFVIVDAAVIDKWAFWKSL